MMIKLTLNLTYQKVWPMWRFQLLLLTAMMCTVWIQLTETILIGILLTSLSALKLLQKNVFLTQDQRWARNLPIENQFQAGWSWSNLIRKSLNSGIKYGYLLTNQGLGSYLTSSDLQETSLDMLEGNVLRLWRPSRGTGSSQPA